jgi:hypothetical protein
LRWYNRREHEAGPAPDPSLVYLDLNHSNKRNAFEHDAFLSLMDYYFSDDDEIAKFDNATFDR